MANLITESFDWFPTGQTSAERERLWSANHWFPAWSSAPDVETGRFGQGKAMVVNNGDFGGGFATVIPVGADLKTGFVGFAMFVYPNNDSGNFPYVQLYDGVQNWPQLTIQFAANGVIKVYKSLWNNSLGTLIANSRPDAFQEEEWFHVELKGKIDNSSGTLEIRINTVPVIQLVAADTRGQYNAAGVPTDLADFFDCIALGATKGGGLGSLIHFAVDDLFVNDTVGATNSDWTGNVKVRGQFMIADGAVNDFAIGGTSPAATNWQSVLNNVLNDTKYVYSSNIGDYDLYTPDPNLNSPLVHVVQVRMGLRQDDATQRSAKAAIRIGAVTYDDDVEQFTNQTYTFYYGRWELNPSTGVAFTGAEVNAIQAGVKLES